MKKNRKKTEIILPENESSNTSKFNKYLGIINVLLFIFAILISIWTVKHNDSVDEKSGKFDKGDLKLSFGGYFVLPNKDFDVFMGVNFSDSTLHFGTLPLGLHNWGEKTVENIGLLIKYPHIANIAIKDSLIKVEGLFTDEIKRNFYKAEPYDQVMYSVKTINPNFSVETGDLICLREETKNSAIIPVKTKDNARINFSTSFSYSYSITVGIMAKDIKTETFTFHLSIRNQSNLDSFIKEIILEKLEAKKKGEICQAFFVIIPKLIKIIGKDRAKVSFLESNSSNTLLCQFDDEFKTLIILNQDGTINKLMKLDEIN